MKFFQRHDIYKKKCVSYDVIFVALFYHLLIHYIFRKTFRPISFTVVIIYYH